MCNKALEDIREIIRLRPARLDIMQLQQEVYKQESLQFIHISSSLVMPLRRFSSFQVLSDNVLD